MAGIVVLHVVAIGVLITMKGPSADARQQTPPIEVMLIKEPPAASPPPEVRSQLPDLPMPQLVVPIINIEVPVTPPPITVAAVAPPAPPAAVAAPKPVSDGDTDSPVSISEANWVRMPAPVYPAAAKRAKAQGVVLVRALVDGTGHALKAVVHRTSGFAALDRAACDSVLGALFRPYMHNGAPRSVDVIIPITFALNGRGGGGDRGPPPRGRGRDDEKLELDVRGENHHAMRGHPEELGSLGAAALHVGE